MPTALVVALILALAVLVGVAVPLILQLTRTARAAERFMESAQADLGRIREDIHATRERIDALAASLQPALDQAARLAGTLRQVSDALEGMMHRYREAYESLSRNVGLALGGLSALVRFFKGEKSDATPP